MRSPSRTEIAGLWLLALVLFALVITHFQSYAAEVDNFGDNGSYLNAAHAIHDWNFQNVNVKQFWGLSYAIALFSFVPTLSPRTVLVVLCATCSLASVLSFTNSGAHGSPATLQY